MLLKFSFLFLCTVLGEAYTPASDEYLLKDLIPLLHPLNGLLLDGPASISNAPITLNRNKLPTVDQLKYYNYYAASTYYAYALCNLTCEYCLKFRNDVKKHKGK